MTNSREPNFFASQLLRQEEALDDSLYEDYRRKLEHAVTTARRRERLTYWICTVSGVVMLTMMFVGGSKMIGDFDPWSKEANAWSVAAGMVCWIVTVIFFLCLASYYSRFRPGTREAREQLRDVSILELQRQVCELRTQIESYSSRGEPEPKESHSGRTPAVDELNQSRPGSD